MREVMYKSANVIIRLLLDYLENVESNCTWTP
jgi:hypothetical protein